MLHQFIRSTTGMTNRFTLDRSLGSKPGLSPLESGLLRLNSHPLIEPGMSMDQVRGQLVLNDELFSPPPPSDFGVAFEAVHAAIGSLDDAGSVRFDIRGTGIGSCQSEFGPASYVVIDSGDVLAGVSGYRRPDLIGFAWDEYEFLIEHGARTLARVEGRWMEVDPLFPYTETSWTEQYAGLYELLASVLRPTQPTGLAVVKHDDGRFTIQSTSVHPDIDRNMSLTIDPETDQILAFGVNWTSRPGPCVHSVVAENARYAIDRSAYGLG